MVSFIKVGDLLKSVYYLTDLVYIFNLVLPEKKMQIFKKSNHIKHLIVVRYPLCNKIPEVFLHRKLTSFIFFYASLIDGAGKSHFHPIQGRGKYFYIKFIACYYAYFVCYF